jgi:GNAT superfamily N-acetyltransferase
MHREAHPEIFQEAADPSEIKDYLLSGIKAKDTVIFVAEKSGKIIGAIIAGLRQSAEISLLVKSTYVSIDNLVIIEEYRKQGVGQALMEQIHHWAQEWDIKYVQLTVWEFNQDAIAFYEKLGYQMLHHRMRKELP